MIIPELYKKSRNIFYRTIEPLAYVVGSSGAVISLTGSCLKNDSLENIGGDIFALCVLYLLGSRIKDSQFEKVTSEDLEKIVGFGKKDLDKDR